MELKWTSKALSALARLHEFMYPLNKQTAASAVQALTSAPVRLLAQPRIGERLEEFGPREVRRIHEGDISNAWPVLITSLPWAKLPTSTCNRYNSHGTHTKQASTRWKL